MKIYIVSSGRPQRQITAAQFLPNTRHDVIIVAPEKEQQEYLEDASSDSFLFHNKFGICATRQFVLDYAIDQGKIGMLDDDLSFYKRLEQGNFIKASQSQVEDMFDEIEAKLDQFAHVGICDKFMSHLQPRDFITNGRYNQVLGYNLDMFPRPLPNFRVMVGEEQDFNLQLLAKGRESCILTEWSKSTTAYAPGGCSVWRTAEVERKAHEDMVKMWPDLCSLRENKSTISRTSLTIRWKNAIVQDPDFYPFEITCFTAE